MSAGRKRHETHGAEHDGNKVDSARGLALDGPEAVGAADDRARLHQIEEEPESLGVELGRWKIDEKLIDRLPYLGVGSRSTG